MWETNMLTHTVLILTGTNSSDSMEHTSTTNKAKSWELKATRMKKESMLDKIVERINLHSNGPSNTLIRWLTSDLRVWTQKEDFISTDHSTLNQNCGCRESLVFTPTSHSSSKPELIQKTNNGTLIKLQRQSRMSRSQRNPLISEELQLMHMIPTQDGINSGNMKVNTL